MSPELHISSDSPRQYLGLARAGQWDSEPETAPKTRRLGRSQTPRPTPSARRLFRPRGRPTQIPRRPGPPATSCRCWQALGSDHLTPNDLGAWMALRERPGAFTALRQGGGAHPPGVEHSPWKRTPRHMVPERSPRHTKPSPTLGRHLGIHASVAPLRSLSHPARHLPDAPPVFRRVRDAGRQPVGGPDHGRRRVARGTKLPVVLRGEQ